MTPSCEPRPSCRSGLRIVAALGLAGAVALAGLSGCSSPDEAEHRRASPPKVVHLRPGASLEAAMVAAGKRGTVVVDAGTHPAAHVDARGLGGKDVSGLTVRGASRSKSIIDGLDLDGVHDITVSNLTVTNDASSGTSALRVRRGSTGITLDHLTVLPKAYSGVDIQAKTRDITLQDSRVDGSGVTGRRASDGTSRAVRINGAPYDLASWPVGITIKDNDLQRAGSDIIQIVGARDVLVQGNFLHSPQVNSDHNDGLQAVGSKGLRIIDNRFTAPGPNGPNQAIILGGTDGSNPLKVDDTTITGNLIEHWRGTGIVVSGASRTVIRRNTVVDNGTSAAPGSALSVSSKNDKITVVDNVMDKIEAKTRIDVQYGNCVGKGASSKDVHVNHPRFVDQETYVLSPKSKCAGKGARLQQPSGG